MIHVAVSLNLIFPLEIVVSINVACLLKLRPCVLKIWILEQMVMTHSGRMEFNGVDFNVEASQAILLAIQVTVLAINDVCHIFLHVLNAKTIFPYDFIRLQLQIQLHLQLQHQSVNVNPFISFYFFEIRKFYAHLLLNI